MQSNYNRNHFNLNYKNIIIDEIALEGLDGIGFKLLWARLEHRLACDITDKMKKRFWSYIVNCSCIDIYNLSEPATVFKIEDRFKYINEETGTITITDFYFDGPYDFKLIPEEYGSSSNYDKRTHIPRSDISSMPYEELIEKYGDTIIFVASLEERWHSIAPQEPFRTIDQLKSTAYAVLELIGKGRENGQLTVGHTNISKISNDPKMIFYYKNKLEELSLIKSITLLQYIEKKNVKSILLRLPRFYKPKNMTEPKEGVLCDLKAHLLSLPGHKDSRINLLQNKIITQATWKRLLKKINQYKFETEHNRQGVLVRTHIILGSDTEESDQSDDLNETENLPRQQVIGVNLYTQAYNVLLQAGLKGLTQIELGSILGVNFYAGRSICRILKKEKLVRTLNVVQGRQKTRKESGWKLIQWQKLNAQFIINSQVYMNDCYSFTLKFIANTASDESLQVYANEKQKLLDLLADNEIRQHKRKISTVENEEVPAKRIKLEDDSETDVDHTDISKNIVEYSVKNTVPTLSMSETLSSASTGMTLRQLKIAYAIIKIIREYKVVETFKVLNHLICKEVGPPSLDVKSLHRLLSKLAADGQLRVYKINWPGYEERNTVIVCLPNMTKNHPSILSVYSKIALHSKKKKTEKIQKQQQQEHKTKLFTHTYSRYLKIRKLHEYMFNLVYLNPDEDGLFNNDITLPKGFATIGHVLAGMPLELAVGHLSVKKLYDLNYVNYEEAGPKLKLQDAPVEIRQSLLYCDKFLLALKTSIDILTSFGLLQTCFGTELITNSIADKYKQIFYLNRNAKIVDTRGKWPREPAENTNHRTYTFYFDNIDVVNKYWSVLQDVCLRTKIVTPKNKTSVPLKNPIRSMEEVTQYDNGEILGDGEGAGGVHSSFRIDTVQLWKMLKILPSKKVPVIKKVKKINRQLKRAPRAKKKSKKEPKKPIPKPENILQKPESTKSFNKNFTWKSTEDEIILWTKAAMTVLSPSTVAGYLQITNLVAKDLLSLRGCYRTMVQCIKRGKYLETDNKFIYQKQLLVSELRRNGSVLKNYEGVLKNIRSKHASNIKNYIQESRIKLLELVWIVKQLSRFIENRNVVPAVASNYNQFHETYSIVTTNSNKSLSFYRTPDDCPIEIAALKEGIVSVLSLGSLGPFPTSTSVTIYKTFNIYGERLLRMATDQLHKSSAVSIKDKFMNNQLQKSTTYNDIVQYAAGYKLSSVYKRRWNNRMNSSFVDNIVNLLESFEPTNRIKSVSEVCCFLLELNCLNVLKLVTTQPPIIPTIVSTDDIWQQMDKEMRNNFKSGRVGWTNTSNVKFMKDLYKSIDYCATIILLIRNSTVKNVGKNITFEEENHLLTSLDEASSNGRTFQQLQELTGYSTDHLKVTLEKLEEEHIVKRVGYDENLIVLTKHLQPWCIKFDDTSIIPSPWFKLGLQIIYPIFINWCGTILNKIFENPGSSVAYLAEFLDYITPRSVHDVCMFFQKCECVTLKTVVVKKTDLFSDDDDYDSIVLTDFNEYASFDCTLVFPVADCITKFAYAKSKIKEYCVDSGT